MSTAETKLGPYNVALLRTSTGKIDQHRLLKVQLTFVKITIYLNWLGDSPALHVLNILTALLGDIVTFLTGDFLISGLLLLATILDRLLGALLRGHSLVNSLLHVLALLLGHTATTLLLAGARVRLTFELRLQKTELGAAE